MHIRPKEKSDALCENNDFSTKFNFKNGLNIVTPFQLEMQDVLVDRLHLDQKHDPLKQLKQTGNHM